MHGGSPTAGMMACRDCPPVTKAVRGVSHVHEDDQSHHGGGAPGAELAAALHHLRHAKPRTLRRMQRHENRAGEVADEDGNTPERKDWPKTVVASAPVTTVSTLIFAPNQSVNSCRALPCR